MFKLIIKIIKYMITKIQGKIVSEVAIKTHVDPQPIKDAGNINSGEETNSQLSFINTGNVPQTIRINGVLNVENCEIISGGDAVDVEIPAGESYSHNIIYKVDETLIGSEPLDFSFDIDYEWL